MKANIKNKVNNSELLIQQSAYVRYKNASSHCFANLENTAVCICALQECK